jgi:hypothetical protein
MKFLRVTFGVTSSPFLLNATIRHHLSLFPETRVVKELKCNLYVDDWLTGADSEEEALEMFAEAQSVMSKANFNLAKWNSNSVLIGDKVGISGVPDSVLTKILGVVWHPLEDCFTFEGVSIPSDLVITKRVVLSCIARLFDPMGFVAPFIMSAKCLFQELWTLGIPWDDEIPEELGSSFSQWILGLEQLKGWKIQRQYFDLPWKVVNQHDLQIHVFGDASERGYGAVVYACTPLSDGQYKSSLIMSKCKVAPLKKITLPRLELMSCLIAARLLKFVKESLELSNSVIYRCYTDSTVALSWVKGNPNKWKQFVSNRVREIQDLTDPSSWSHCPGKDNPADLLTRGISANTLMESSLWLEGPVWLSDPCLVPSTDQLTDKNIDSGQEEHVVATCTTTKLENPFAFQRWSTFTKVVRIVAWVLRFIHNTKSKETKLSGELAYDEITSAKIMVFQLEQKEAFASEFDCLDSGKAVPKQSPLKKFNPFLDTDGLMKVKGRLQFSNLSFDEKHPLILPKGHISKLIVRHQHLILKHAGVSTMINTLRASYWILGLRRLAKSVKRECFSCQRQDSQACCQPAAPLPKLRVSESPPFSVTGMDFAGPLYCVDVQNKKFYFCIFTCAVIRAIHLEITDSLSTEDFMLAFRRFSARRGFPTVLYSDNAKSFKAASVRLQAYYGHSSPEWKWIVPRSPWWGGWWERLVRSVKSALRKTIGKRCLTRCELETTLTEIEACVNSRPLCFVSDEFDCPNSLTPSHFLIGRTCSFQVEVEEDFEGVSSKILSERERVRQNRLDEFWQIWRTEYLRNLPTSVPQFGSRGGLKVGSVVLVRDDGKVPRMQWQLGVVLELYPGRDNIVRSVKVNTKKGPIVRSVQLLHDLELEQSDRNSSMYYDTQGEPITPTNDTTDVSNLPVVRHNPDMPTSPVTTRSGRVVKPVQRLNL